MDLNRLTRMTAGFMPRTVNNMPHRADPVLQLAYIRRTGKNIRRYEILTVLIDFAKETQGPTPSVRGLCRLFNRRCHRYGFMPIPYGTFQAHISKLIAEGLIEKKEGLLCVVDANWKPPNNLPLIDPVVKQLSD